MNVAPPLTGTPALRRGSVAITGAGGEVGTALQRRMTDFANDVQPLGRRDHLAAAIRSAEVVVLLDGTLRPVPPNTYVGANLRTVESMVEALAGSSVERVVFLSCLGADPHSDNEYLRAKGLAEEVVRRSGRDAVVFRCGHVYGPPEEPGPTAGTFLSKQGRPVRVIGNGRQRIMPLYREDVVDAIVRAALDASSYHGRFDLTGPETMTVDEFVLALNGGSVALRHLPPRLARTLARVVPGLPPPLVEVMLADATGDPGRAVSAFGLELRRLTDIYPVAARTAA